MANYNAEFCEEAAETAFIVHAESGRLRGAGGVSAGNPRMESKKGKKKRRRKNRMSAALSDAVGLIRVFQDSQNW